MKNLVLIVALMFIYFGCEGPQELPSTPDHISRVPNVFGFQAVKDTLASGKTIVFLSWQSVDSSRVKSFEMFRSLNVLGRFKMETKTNGFALVDSFATASTDSVVYYFISPIGNDLFTGKSSDTILVNIKK